MFDPYPPYPRAAGNYWLVEFESDKTGERCRRWVRGKTQGRALSTAARALRTDRWTSVEIVPTTMRYRPGECPTCRTIVDEGGWNAMAPAHEASARCESGKNPHCSCAVCF